MLRSLVVPVGCYLIGTLVGSLHYRFAPASAGSILLLLLTLFYGAFSLFGPLLTVASSFGFGLLTGGISAALLTDFSAAGLVCLLFLVFLLAPFLLMLAAVGLRCALSYIELLMAWRRENDFSLLTGRLFLALAASVAAVLLYGTLVRLLL